MRQGAIIPWYSAVTPDRGNRNLAAMRTLVDQLSSSTTFLFRPGRGVIRQWPRTCGPTDIVSVILAKNWWSLVVRGAVAIALGFIALAAHQVSIGTLVLAFFGYALIDGLIALAGAVRAAESHQRWASLLVEALADIAVAFIAIAWPSITALG